MVNHRNFPREEIPKMLFGKPSQKKRPNRAYEITFENFLTQLIFGACTQQHVRTHEKGQQFVLEVTPAITKQQRINRLGHTSRTTEPSTSNKRRKSAKTFPSDLLRCSSYKTNFSCRKRRRSDGEWFVGRWWHSAATYVTDIRYMTSWVPNCWTMLNCNIDRFF